MLPSAATAAMDEGGRMSSQSRWLIANETADEAEDTNGILADAEDRARQEGQGIDESVVEGIRALISQHQTIAWQAVLGHVVTQLTRAGVVAAELWTRSHNADGDVELYRAPGGFFADPSFTPPEDARESFEKLQADRLPPNVPGMGLAGIHWSVGIDRGDDKLERSRRGGLPPAGDLEGGRHHRGRRRESKELHFPHDHDDWQWHRLAYLLENPELIFDDHARHVAKVFGLVHLLKFKSTDLGGVVILYTSKANVENAKALEHSSTRTFSHTIPRLVMSHCVTIPFTLDLGAVLQELKGALDRACYVILWDTSGGQYRIIAHHVGKERRNQLKELRGDDKTYCTESYGIAIDPSGHGPIASAARTGRHVFLANAAAPDAQTRHMRRAPLLSDFGIHDVYFLPVALGVLEFGLSKSPRDVAMEEIGRFTSMMGGSSVFAYVMFWSKVEEKDGLFHVVADYVCEDRKRQLRELRGDDRTFCSESYGVLGLDPAGKSPIAVAARTGKQLSVTDAFTCPTFQRRELAAGHPARILGAYGDGGDRIRHAEVRERE